MELTYEQWMERVRSSALKEFEIEVNSVSGTFVAIASQFFQAQGPETKKKFGDKYIQMLQKINKEIFAQPDRKNKTRSVVIMHFGQGNVSYLISEGKVVTSGVECVEFSLAGYYFLLRCILDAIERVSAVVEKCTEAQLVDGVFGDSIDFQKLLEDMQSEGEFGEESESENWGDPPEAEA